MSNLNKPVLDEKDAEIFALSYKLKRLERENSTLQHTISLMSEKLYKHEYDMLFEARPLTASFSEN